MSAAFATTTESQDTGTLQSTAFSYRTCVNEILEGLVSLGAESKEGTERTAAEKAALTDDTVDSLRDLEWMTPTQEEHLLQLLTSTSVDISTQLKKVRSILQARGDRMGVLTSLLHEAHRMGFAIGADFDAGLHESYSLQIAAENRLVQAFEEFDFLQTYHARSTLTDDEQQEGSPPTIEVVARLAAVARERLACLTRAQNREREEDFFKRYLIDSQLRIGDGYEAWKREKQLTFAANLSEIASLTSTAPTSAAEMARLVELYKAIDMLYVD